MKQSTIVWPYSFTRSISRKQNKTKEQKHPSKDTISIYVLHFLPCDITPPSLIIIYPSQGLGGIGVGAMLQSWHMLTELLWPSPVSSCQKAVLCLASFTSFRCSHWRWEYFVSAQLGGICPISTEYTGYGGVTHSPKISMAWSTEVLLVWHRCSTLRTPRGTEHSHSIHGQSSPWRGKLSTGSASGSEMLDLEVTCITMFAAHWPKVFTWPTHKGAKNFTSTMVLRGRDLYPSCLPLFFYCSFLIKDFFFLKFTDISFCLALKNNS